APGDADFHEFHIAEQDAVATCERHSFGGEIESVRSAFDESDLVFVAGEKSRDFGARLLAHLIERDVVFGGGASGGEQSDVEEIAHGIDGRASGQTDASRVEKNAVLECRKLFADGR